MSTARKFDFENKIISELSELELSEKMYNQFASRMYELSGVNLPFTPKNHALIRNRIMKILRREKLKSYEQYWDYLTKGNREIVNEFISALTTNMTSFYREADHFDFFNDHMKEVYLSKSEIRIWCAAASTGQEPYTIAISAAEAVPEHQKNKIKILATDIDLEVLAKASRGVYEEREMQGLPVTLRQKYFKVKRQDGDDYFRVEDEIRHLITFAQFNLMNEQYQFKKNFDLIFCRNVLIYFNQDVQRQVISKLTGCLNPGGFLILGHSESGNVKHENLQPMSKAIYKKIG